MLTASLHGSEQGEQAQISARVTVSPGTPVQDGINEASCTGTDVTGGHSGLEDWGKKKELAMVQKVAKNLSSIQHCQRRRKQPTFQSICSASQERSWGRRAVRAPKE